MKEETERHRRQTYKPESSHGAIQWKKMGKDLGKILTGGTIAVGVATNNSQIIETIPVLGLLSHMFLSDNAEKNPGRTKTGLDSIDVEAMLGECFAIIAAFYISIGVIQNRYEIAKTVKETAPIAASAIVNYAESALPYAAALSSAMANRSPGSIPKRASGEAVQTAIPRRRKNHLSASGGFTLPTGVTLAH